MRAAAQKGAILFHKREWSPLDPPRERFRLAVWSLNNLCASGMQLPARGVAALALLYDLTCSYLRCRSASLAQVQPNFRLLMVPINAASAAMPHSAGSLPPR